MSNYSTTAKALIRTKEGPIIQEQWRFHVPAASLTDAYPRALALFTDRRLSAGDELLSIDMRIAPTNLHELLADHPTFGARQ